MTRLWLADVHANLPAFEAVLADAGEVDEVVFLGDLVGYGPHPAACVERLMSLGARAVLGNHDVAVLAWRERAAAPDAPLNWDQWTLGQLGPAHLAHLAALPNREIGERLGIVESIVRQVLRRVHDKLGVDSTKEALRKLAERGVCPDTGTELKLLTESDEQKRPGSSIAEPEAAVAT